MLGGVATLERRRVAPLFQPGAGDVRVFRRWCVLLACPGIAALGAADAGDWQPSVTLPSRPTRDGAQAKGASHDALNAVQGRQSLLLGLGDRIASSLFAR
jgi:hypothetical protein